MVAGSIATGDGALRLIEAGADGVRCGIGNGSICITRIVAGAGVPQLSALFSVAPVCKKYGVPLISDGGVIFINLIYIFRIDLAVICAKHWLQGRTALC